MIPERQKITRKSSVGEKWNQRDGEREKRKKQRGEAELTLADSSGRSDSLTPRHLGGSFSVVHVCEEETKERGREVSESTKRGRRVLRIELTPITDEIKNSKADSYCESEDQDDELKDGVPEKVSSVGEVLGRGSAAGEERKTKSACGWESE